MRTSHGKAISVGGENGGTDIAYLTEALCGQLALTG
jgi:hypothetical protein